MPKSTLRVLKIHIETLVDGPKTLAEAGLAEFARNALVAFSGYGLQGNAIEMNKQDDLYRYDLNFTLFNGNCKIRLGSDKLETTLGNVTSAQDLEIVRAVVLKAQECLASRQKLANAVELSMHLSLPTTDERDQCLKNLNRGMKEIKTGGIIAYLQSDELNSEVRLTIDRSIVYGDGLYVTWESTLGGVFGKQQLEYVDKHLKTCLRLFNLIEE